MFPIQLNPIYNTIGGYSSDIPSGINGPAILERKKSNSVTYIITFFLVVAVVAIIILVVINATMKSNYVSPDQCPVIKANYASIPSVYQSKLQVIQKCSASPDGSSGNQACTFNNINSLLEAENICNLYPSTTCSGFGLNGTTMSFINTSYDLTSVNNPSGVVYDIYIKQNL